MISSGQRDFFLLQARTLICFTDRRRKVVPFFSFFVLLSSGNSSTLFRFPGENFMDAGPGCICPHYRAVGSSACGFCGGGFLPPESPVSDLRPFEVIRSFRAALRLAIAALVGAAVGLFAIGGALLGATAGALVGWASNRGIIRGSLLGAAAGTVLSLEIVEALQAYGSLEETDARGQSSVADLLQELIRARFVESHLEPPALLTSFSQQVSIETWAYSDTYDDVYDKFPRGLSGESLKKLPHQVIQETAAKQKDFCCSICLENIDAGETARRLPGCQHMFHLTCVDKWLVMQGSCPLCRQIVQV
ncbi:hypothetical protein SAY87_006437 [Trapa incisa]|uniref:RING-type domain-containing protein n=1 Tax=Trapa incisa TaxID=236973 RepID=A0AAN7K2B0_9MYRT|nr:hypothetical protein SAY87_006437 [Trapa incisa]